MSKKDQPDKVKHKWTRWKLSAPDKCEKRRECLLTGEVQVTPVDHLWSNWQRDSENACMRYRVCSRCQTREVKEQHKWDSVDNDGNGNNWYVCVNCGAKSPPWSDEEALYFDDDQE